MAGVTAPLLSKADFGPGCRDGIPATAVLYPGAAQAQRQAGRRAGGRRQQSLLTGEPTMTRRWCQAHIDGTPPLTRTWRARDQPPSVRTRRTRTRTVPCRGLRAPRGQVGDIFRRAGMRWTGWYAARRSHVMRLAATSAALQTTATCQRRAHHAERSAPAPAPARPKPPGDATVQGLAMNPPLTRRR
jgi:hypothetical protein